MKVTVFGTGYVGLVQAAVLAEVGHDVACIDVDAKRIAQLQAGEVAIYEPGLTELVRRCLAENRLHFSTDAAHGVAFGKVVFIAVGTPARADGAADLEAVESVAHDIGSHISAARHIVIKSTVSVGTADRVRAIVAARCTDRGVSVPFTVTSNPEFLKEGSAVADCKSPDRIIVGTSDPEAERVLRELYAPFNRNHEKMIVMDPRSAELTKYAANAMLATKISFINEMAALADHLGADIEWVRKGIGADPRIGTHFIYPGIGYGGSCFPKDVQALIHAARSAGVESDLLAAVEKRNQLQKYSLVDKVLAHFGGDIAGRTFALWGLAFKPNTSDMREAPARTIMEGLWSHGAKLRAFDPAAMGECREIYGDRPDLVLAANREDALEGADALILATEWRQFQAVDFEGLAQTLRARAVFDGRNMLIPEAARAAGLAYYSIGRAHIASA